MEMLESGAESFTGDAARYRLDSSTARFGALCKEDGWLEMTDAIEVRVTLRSFAAVRAGQDDSAF
jgi:hypothetical protein